MALTVFAVGAGQCAGASKDKPAAAKKTAAAGTKARGAAPARATTYREQVLELINRERTARGLRALKQNTEWDRVAQTKSDDMAARRYFKHYSPTYGMPFDMLDRAGIRYNCAAENIAAGVTTPEAVVDLWMNSRSHRKNILDGNFTDMGIARDAQGRSYWTQLFIGTRGPLYPARMPPNGPLSRLKNRVVSIVHD